MKRIKSGEGGRKFNDSFVKNLHCKTYLLCPLVTDPTQANYTPYKINPLSKPPLQITIPLDLGCSYWGIVMSKLHLYSSNSVDMKVC